MSESREIEGVVARNDSRRVELRDRFLVHSLLQVNLPQAIVRHAEVGIQLERLPQLSNGPLVVAAKIELPAQGRVDDQGKRIELLGPLDGRDRFLLAADRCEI